MDYGTVSSGKDPGTNTNEGKVYFGADYPSSSKKSKLTTCQKFTRDLSLTSVQGVLFVKSDWETGSNVSLGYLLYRMVFMLFLWAIFIQAFLCDTYLNHFFIYLTNISLTIQVIYGTLNFAQVFAAYFSSNEAEDQWTIMRRSPDDLDPEGQSLLSDPPQELRSQVSGFQSLVWIFYTFSWSIPLLVTFTYWAFIFEGFEDNYRACDYTTNFSTHIGNTALAIIDLLFVAIPLHVSHIIYVTLIGLGYIFFTILYEYTGGTYPKPDEDYIYSVIDWGTDSSRAALNSFLILCLVEFFHILGWILVKLRIFILARCIRNQEIYQEHSSTPKKRSPVGTPKVSLSFHQDNKNQEKEDLTNLE